MSISPSRVSQPRIRVTVRIVAILTSTAFWLPVAAAQDPPKQEHLALDLRKPLNQLPDLSLYGHAVESTARTDDQGLHFTVPPGRENVDLLGVEWISQLHGDFDVSIGYELISVGKPLPQYGAGVSLQLWYDTPDSQSTALSRLKSPEDEHFLAQRILMEGGGKTQFLDNKTAPATRSKGRLRMVRNGARLRFLAAEGGDYQEIQSINIGAADVRKIQVFCNTGYTPVGLEARFTDLDLRADRILGSWVEPAPRSGQARLAFDLRAPVDQLSPASLFGPISDSTVRTDPKGLRLTLPGGREDTNPVGLELTKRLSGDFDVSFGYELLEVGGPLEQYGVALELKVWFDAPKRLCALLVRTRRKYGDRFIAFRVQTEPDGQDAYLDGKEVAATGPQGKLRLVRTGSKIHYLTSESGNYREIETTEIGNADVWKVQAQATTIWSPILLDARFTDFNVQADRIQDHTAGTDPEPVSSSDEKAGSRGLLYVVLFGGLAVLLVVLGVGGLLFFRRRWSAGEPAKSAQIVPDTNENFVTTFACEECRRAIKARSELAGKRVKCPGCGKPVVVPARNKAIMP